MAVLAQTFQLLIQTILDESLVILKWNYEQLGAIRR